MSIRIIKEELPNLSSKELIEIYKLAASHLHGRQLISTHAEEIVEISKTVQEMFGGKHFTEQYGSMTKEEVRAAKARAEQTKVTSGNPVIK